MNKLRKNTLLFKECDVTGSFFGPMKDIFRPQKHSCTQKKKQNKKQKTNKPMQIIIKIANVHIL